MCGIFDTTLLFTIGYVAYAGDVGVSEPPPGSYAGDVGVYEPLCVAVWGAARGCARMPGTKKRSSI